MRKVMFVEGAETSESKWFPVLVSSIEDEYKILADFKYKYDEKGRLVQSPIRLSNLMNRMVDANGYFEYLDYNASSGDSEEFIYQIYGSDFETYCYSYNDDGTVYECSFMIDPDDIVLYSDYLSSCASEEIDVLNQQLYFLEDNLYYEDNSYYGIIEYSGDYVTGVTIKERFDEELWNKYLDLNKLKGEEDYANALESIQFYSNEADTYIDRCSYYYNLYNQIEVRYDDENLFVMECDDHKNSVFYDIGDCSSPYYLVDDETANYYNGYDEYGNLIYRVRYSDDVSVSYDSPLRDSALTDMFEFKTVTTTRQIEQIDMYTYAYGNPAEYYKNPDAFETRTCDLTIAEIVDIVGGDEKFVQGCTSESDYMDNK